MKLSYALRTGVAFAEERLEELNAERDAALAPMTVYLNLRKALAAWDEETVTEAAQRVVAERDHAIRVLVRLSERHALASRFRGRKGRR